MKKLYTLFLLALLAGCSSPEEVKPELTADFTVTDTPEFNHTVYPSLIFGLTEVEKQTNETIPYFRIKVTPSFETDIRLVIQESKMNFETIITKTNVQALTEIVPSIKWKYDDLKNLTQPGNVDMTFVCYGDDNKEIGRQNIKLGYRSINECVFAAVIEGKPNDLRWMFAAYVNEDSPVIDAFLKQVLQRTQLPSFVGYQQGQEAVFNQVGAIFYTMRDLGVKYSSITATSNTNPKIFSQYVRFSDEVLNNTQANCADGTAFFCSALRKIGIKPVMVFVPGHVYLGYFMDEQKTSIQLLETTAVGEASLDFIDATNYQVDEFNAHISDLNAGRNGYFLVDIETARQIIKPIGR